MKPKFKTRTLEQLNSLTEGLVRHEINEHEVEKDYSLPRFKKDMGKSLNQYEKGTKSFAQRSAEIDAENEKAYQAHLAQKKQTSLRPKIKQQVATKQEPSRVVHPHQVGMRPVDIPLTEEAKAIATEKEIPYRHNKMVEQAAMPAPKWLKNRTVQPDAEEHSKRLLQLSERYPEGSALREKYKRQWFEYNQKAPVVDEKGGIFQKPKMKTKITPSKATAQESFYMSTMKPKTKK